MVYNQHWVFEYDPIKSKQNKLKHGIDFEEAKELWKSPTTQSSVPHPQEDRFLVVGTILGRQWTAVITMRAEIIRIISVRRSRHEERKKHETETQTD